MAGVRNLLNEHREAIEQLCLRFGARNLRVLGSVARGEDGEQSDVDLLVEFEPGRSLLDHAGLTIALERLLGRRVEVASEHGLRPALRDRILQEACPL